MRSLPVAVLAAVALTGGACSIPNMPVASTLAPQQPFDRSIMSRGDVRFGAFRVTGFNAESASETWRGDVLPQNLRHGEGFEDYSFNVEEAGQPPRLVRCSAAMHSSSLHEGRTTITSSSQELHCAIWLTPGAREIALLDLGGDGQGTLAGAGRQDRVEGRNMQGHADTLDPAGHAIIDGGRDVALVQRVNGGAVWLAGDAAGADRGLYAAAAAALLLYQPLSTH
jgi:hypothetical protein